MSNITINITIDITIDITAAAALYVDDPSAVPFAVELGVTG